MKYLKTYENKYSEGVKKAQQYLRDVENIFKENELLCAFRKTAWNKTKPFYERYTIQNLYDR